MLSPAAGPTRVEVRGWGWRHAGRRDWALRGVDLAVEPGERVLLLGPSGAGKSTLLTALAGLHDPESSGQGEGVLVVDGQPPRQVRRRIGLLTQDPETQLVMARAGDDVAFGLENRAVPTAGIWPRVDEALAAVGFRYGRDRPTGALSGGEQQRLALAGVLALRPGLLLLDEPTANLDPQGADLLRSTLAAVLAQTGATTVLVEHRVADALPLVDRVVVLEPGGGVIADGIPAQVFARDGTELAARGVWTPDRPVPRRRARHAPAAELLRATQVSSRPADEAVPAPVVDLSLRQGEAVAVTGPNGSGKSTLAMLMAGLLAPTTGAVHATTALGDPRRPLHRWRAADLVGAVGTVYQEPEHSFLASTVVEELEFGPLRGGMAVARVQRRSAELLVRLGLESLAQANPFTLSGGQKRRLSVAAALATAPPVLVLDEPTFGQDARSWDALLALLADLRDDGTAVLAVTHDEPFVDALADRRLSLAGSAVAA